MHYVDFDAKRKQTLIRFGLYILFGSIALVITFLVVSAAKGYYINPITGEVAQNGLVLVNAEPEPAEIFVDGIAENDATPGRLPLPEGQYNISLEYEGYHTWKKLISLQGEEVIRLSYPILFPKQIETQNIASFENYEFWSKSPNGEKIIMRASNSSRNFLYFDLDNPTNPPEVFSLPSGVINKVNGKYGEIVPIDWSKNSRYLILEHTAGKQVEYALVDTENFEESYNIEKKFKAQFERVRFNGDNENEFFVVNKKTLYLAKASTSEFMDTPLVKDVVTFNVDSKDVHVLAKDPDTKKDFVYIVKDLNVQQPVEVLVNATEDHISKAKYETHDYTVLKLNDNRIAVYEDLGSRDSDNNPITVLELKDIEFLGFSGNGQFIAVRSGKSIMTFDLEKFQKIKFNVKELGERSSISWLDGHHLGISGENGKYIVMEFDGDNRTELGDTLVNAPGIIVGKFEQLLLISPNERGDFVIKIGDLIL